MSNIKELAEKKATAELIYRSMANMNRPENIEDQIKLSARYQLAGDAMMKATNDYNTAIRNMSADELTALINAPSAADDKP